GAAEIVDPFVVEDAVRRAGSSVMRVRPTPDPDAFRPPPDLLSALEPGRVLEPRRWASLRALERYALVHALRHAPDRAYLHDVFDDVIASAPVSSSAVPSTAPESRAPSIRPPAPAFARGSAPPSTIAA